MEPSNNDGIVCVCVGGGGGSGWGGGGGGGVNTRCWGPAYEADKIQSTPPPPPPGMIRMIINKRLLFNQVL